MNGSSYGVLDRALHWITLQSYSVRALSFDLERSFVFRRREMSDDLRRADEATETGSGAVYVCGLARSGTTVLLRLLNDVGAFRSLSYRDMPFVLAPNLWRLIRGNARRDIAAAERAHGDGMLVDLDSPDAFEEVFWRTFSVRRKHSNVLGPDKLLPDAVSAFADYRRLVSNPRRPCGAEDPVPGRYISKNNNNLMRLDVLASDTSGTILIAYRPPLETARSLLRLHRHFSRLQSEDRFVRRYMDWLGHHEFGLDHRPFWFVQKQLSGSYIPDNINYWLEYWDAVHRHIREQAISGLRLVSHAALRKSPEKMVGAILRAVGVEGDVASIAKHIDSLRPQESSRAGVNEGLLGRAEETYRELTLNERNIQPLVCGG